MPQLGIITAFLYLCGLALEVHIRQPLLRLLPGLLLVSFFPGWYLLEFFNLPTIRKSERAALAIPCTITWIAILGYVIHGTFHLPLTLSVSSYEVAGSTILLALLVIFKRWRQHQYSTVRELLTIRWPSRSSIMSVWPLLAALFIGTLVHVINFNLYPYLPEADGYGLILRLRDVVNSASGTIPSLTYRPLFSLYTILFVRLTGLQLIDSYKYFIPLLLTSIVVYPYLIASKLTRHQGLRLAAALLPFCFPIIVLESEVTRPQIIIILTSFACVWSLIRFREQRSFHYFSLAVLLAVLGMGFHEFSIFNLIAVGLVGIGPLWKLARRHPWQAAWAIFYIVTWAFPYLSHPGIFNLIPQITHTFLEGVSSGRIDWWFIKSYQNYDGNNLGWPGITALFYYGYNLGLVVPLLLILRFLSRKGKDQAADKSPVTAAWSLFAIAFFFAEVSPRFHTIYLPDRAWLYVSISLCFLLVPLLTTLRTRRQYAVLMISLIGSIVTANVITYLKQGWVHPAEYTAAGWIQNHTSSNSLFVSQTGNAPFISVYANRQVTSTRDFFFDTTNQQLQFLSSLEQSSQYTISQTNLLTATAVLDSSLAIARTANTQAAINALDGPLQEQVTSFLQLKRESLSAPPPHVSSDLYILYSTAKFDGLYGKRAWWQEVNAQGASLKAIDALPVTRVYDRGGVTIWKVKNS